MRTLDIDTSWLIAGAEKDTQSVTADWEPVGRTLIHGVVLHDAKVVPKRNGSVTELFRDDWPGSTPGVAHVFVVRLSVGGLSAWHAHDATTDRLSVVDGAATLVLYDARTQSPTCGMVNEFHLHDARPTTVVVPRRVWHGIRNSGDRPCLVANMTDRAYEYDDPDHWRAPADTTAIPYRFETANSRAADR